MDKWELYKKCLMILKNPKSTPEEKTKARIMRSNLNSVYGLVADGQ